MQQWSEQPCVRPVSAVHVTAGHNALRGSGLDQKHAFDNAVARVGCPDRRIDWLRITCCSPSAGSRTRRAAFRVKDDAPDPKVQVQPRLIGLPSPVQIGGFRGARATEIKRDGYGDGAYIADICRLGIVFRAKLMSQVSSHHWVRAGVVLGGTR